MDPVPTQPPAARKEMQATDAAARRIVLAYAVFAGFWILLSDAALGWLFNDPTRLVVAGTIKGGLFVGVTSLLLYFLLRRLVGQVQDVSRSEHGAQAEKLQALQLLDAVAESSTDAIFAKDVDDRFLVFNRAAAHLTGKRPEEVLGRDEMAIFPPDLARQLIADNRRVMAENRVITFEEKLVTPEGPRTHLTTKGPMHDAAGKVIGMFGISRDITERQQAETDLRQNIEELERFNRVAVGRELEMIELKQQVNALSRQLGQEPPYALSFLDSPAAAPKAGEAP